MGTSPYPTISSARPTPTVGGFAAPPILAALPSAPAAATSTLPPIAGSTVAGIEQICSAISSVQNAVAKIISGFLLKLMQLQRLALLLQNIGSLLKLPDVSKLLSILTIDQRLYAQLQAICPELGLPPYTNAETDKLRSAVSNAYSTVQSALDSHPWSKLESLQDTLDSMVGEASKALSGAGVGGGILQCVAKLCQSNSPVDALNGLYNNVTGEVAAAAASPSALEQSLGTALNSTQKSSLDYVKNARSSVSALQNEWGGSKTATTPAQGIPLMDLTRSTQ